MIKKLFITPSFIIGIWPFLLYPLGIIFDGIYRPVIVFLFNSMLIHWLDFIVLCSFSLLYVSLLVRSVFSWINVALYLCFLFFGTYYIITDIGSGNHVATMSFAAVTVYVPIGFYLVKSYTHQ